MEVFVKIIAEDLKSGERKIAATALLTFVALDQLKKPIQVPRVIPETKEEIKLHETAPREQEFEKERKQQSQEWAEFITTNQPWN